MKAVIQVVKSCTLTVEGVKDCSIGRGLFILLGITREDSEKEARILAEKIIRLRIFSDQNDKINLGILDPFICGDALIVSNFTLCANTAASRRPDFFAAAKPEAAEPLYNYFVEYFTSTANAILNKEYNTDRTIRVETGVFGGDMQICPVCDGPHTICMDTDDFCKKA